MTFWDCLDVWIEITSQLDPLTSLIVEATCRNGRVAVSRAWDRTWPTLTPIMRRAIRQMQKLDDIQESLCEACRMPVHQTSESLLAWLLDHLKQTDRAHLQDNSANLYIAAIRSHNDAAIEWLQGNGFNIEGQFMEIVADACGRAARPDLWKKFTGGMGLSFFLSGAKQTAALLSMPEYWHEVGESSKLEYGFRMGCLDILRDLDLDMLGAWPWIGWLVWVCNDVDKILQWLEYDPTGIRLMGFSGFSAPVLNMLYTGSLGKTNERMLLVLRLVAYIRMGNVAGLDKMKPRLHSLGEGPLLSVPTLLECVKYDSGGLVGLEWLRRYEENVLPSASSESECDLIRILDWIKPRFGRSFYDLDLHNLVDCLPLTATALRWYLCLPNSLVKEMCKRLVSTRRWDLLVVAFESVDRTRLKEIQRCKSLKSLYALWRLPNPLIADTTWNKERADEIVGPMLSQS